MEPPLKQGRGGQAFTRRAVIVGLMALVGVGVVGVLLLLLGGKSGRQITWLTSAESERALQSAGLLRLEDKIRVWLAQRLKRFPMAGSGVRIALTMGTVPSAVAWPELGEPTETNDAGVRVWILSAVDFTTFKQKAEGTAGLRSLYAPTLQPKPGDVARIMLADPLPPVPANAPPVAPGSTNRYFGPEIKMLPVFLPGRTRLTVACNLTDFAGWISTNGASVPLIETGFRIAVRMLVPEDGGVVIRAPSTNRPNIPDSIFLVSPYLVDTNGSRIRH